MMNLKPSQKHKFSYEHNSGVKIIPTSTYWGAKRNKSGTKLTSGFIIPEYEVVACLCHKRFVSLVSSKIKES